MAKNYEFDESKHLSKYLKILKEIVSKDQMIEITIEEFKEAYKDAQLDLILDDGVSYRTLLAFEHLISKILVNILPLIVSQDDLSELGDSVFEIVEVYKEAKKEMVLSYIPDFVHYEKEVK